MFSALAIIICTIFFSGINYIRGRGMLGKAHLDSAILWGAASMISAGIMGYENWQAALIGWGCALGSFLWIMMGWGLFFSSFTGIWQIYEREAWPIDRIGLALVPFVAADDQKSNRLRGTICMALRGFIWSIPLFCILAYWLNPWSILLSLGMLLQGPIYYANKKFAAKHGTAIPEIATGALLGWLVGVALMMGL